MNENSSSSSVGKENSAWYVAQEGEHKLTRAPQIVVEKQNRVVYIHTFLKDQQGQVIQENNTLREQRTGKVKVGKWGKRSSKLCCADSPK